MATADDPSTPSQTVLDETPARTLKFLTAVSRNTPIFAALSVRGYTAADHKLGWDTLLAVSGFTSSPAPVTGSNAAAAAIAEIDANDEPMFRLAHAALKTRHPDQDKFLFESLEPAKGIASLVSTTTFLDRLDVLQNGKGRAKKFHAGDKAALETLDSRKIGEAERKRLRELLKQAAAAPDSGALALGPAGDEPVKHAEDLLKLYAWYEEWAETARVLIKRRDYLIRLGLAHRKPTAGDTTDPTEGAGSGGGAGGGK